MTSRANAPQARSKTCRKSWPFTSGDAVAAALFTNDAVYLDRALRLRLLGKPAIGKYLVRAGNDTIQQGLKAHARRRSVRGHHRCFSRVLLLSRKQRPGCFAQLL